MAKVTIYLRVGKRDGRKPYMVDASLKPNYVPLITKGGYNRPDTYLPTAAFGLNLEIPDALFEQAETIVADVNVAMREAMVAADIEVPGKKKRA